jgi:hypothetical protein
MASMGASHGGNGRRVARQGQPVVNRGTDAASFDWRSSGAVMPGDQEDDPLAARKRLFKDAVDRAPGAVEVHPMQVEDPIGLDRAGEKPPVPAAIKGRSRPDRDGERFRALSGCLWTNWIGRKLRLFSNWLRRDFLSR